MKFLSPENTEHTTDMASETPQNSRRSFFPYTQTHQVTLFILNNKTRSSSSACAILSLGITNRRSIKTMDATIFSSSPYLLKHHFLPMPLHLSLIRITDVRAHLVHWGHSTAP